MNEIYFFTHVLLTVVFVLAALRAGKETLAASFGLQVILANLFVTKQMECFGLQVTCSDVYTIGAIFSLNLLQEYYGKVQAKKAVATLFFLLVFFVVMSQMQLLYLPSSFDTVHDSFAAILATAPRIMTVSFAVSIITQRLDVELFALSKRCFPSAGLFLRFGSISLVTQLFDTFAFTFGALYGIVENLGDIVLMSYLIKVAVIFSIAPFTALTKRVVNNATI